MSCLLNTAIVRNKMIGTYCSTIYSKNKGDREILQSRPPSLSQCIWLLPVTCGQCLCFIGRVTPMPAAVRPCAPALPCPATVDMSTRVFCEPLSRLSQRGQLARGCPAREGRGRSEVAESPVPVCQACLPPWLPHSSPCPHSLTRTSPSCSLGQGPPSSPLPSCPSSLLPPGSRVLPRTQPGGQRPATGCLVCPAPALSGHLPLSCRLRGFVTRGLPCLFLPPGEVL